MTIRPTLLVVICALVVVYFAPLQRTNTPPVNVVPVNVVKVVPVKVAPVKVQPKPALPQLAAFTAEWCGPCQHAKPTVDEIENAGLAQVIRVDIDKQADLANQYNITAVPTFILYRGGKEVLRTHDIEEIKMALEKT